MLCVWNCSFGVSSCVGAMQRHRPWAQTLLRPYSDSCLRSVRAYTHIIGGFKCDLVN